MSDTSLIPLKQGGFTVVDSDLREWLAQWVWSLSPEGYAYRYERFDGKPRKLYMHRIINQTPTGCFTDHRNGIKLDNRRANIRTATPAQNGYNAVKHKRGNVHSKFKGVWRSARSAKWVAQIRINGKAKHLGTFDSEIEAAKSYDDAARSNRSDFARTNLDALN